jgi:3-oxoisoapionate kinase
LEGNNLNRDKKILLAFYGDDFTGSTDALEAIAGTGAKTVLFTETPTTEQLDAFDDLDVFGVAGKTRALSPAAMEEILIPAFEQMKSTGAKHVYYKTCSTFDSSPAIGSIGKAIDCGASVFKNKIVPILGGMPSLGRYCLFGNLYARMGIGSAGKIYRLDRHPSMSKHPVTPADESDLRIHIGKQTTKKIGLIDIVQLDKPISEWNEVVDESDEAVLIDVLYDAQLEKIGEWLDAKCNEMTSLFSVGTSGIGKALGTYWNNKRILNSDVVWKKPGYATPLLVISGSCSPVTTEQIAWAKANGFEEVELNAVQVCNDSKVSEQVMRDLNESLRQQKNVIVHTGAKASENLSSEKLGTALGCAAKQAVKTTGIKRVVLSGGDTSSYAARAMEIDAVEMIAPLVIGAPLCKAYSKNKAIQGLEVNFKGGQVGDERYFDVMLRGHCERSEAG